MRTFLFSLLPALLLVLAGCDTGTETGTETGTGTGTTAAEGDAVATVDGKAIPEAQFETYAERRTGSPASELDPQVREQLINELVNIELLAQVARRQDLHEKSPLKEQIEFQRSTAMADAAMTDYLEANPITEEDIRAEYEKRQGELGGEEFKARHILVESEEEADQIITRLDEGADFTELAREHSVEPGADQSGGDLGWFSPAQMVPQFSAAVSSMEPGQRSQEPVQTQFGWHVILLEDTREVAPPPFDEVSERIRRVLMNERIQSYINELRGNAEISKAGDAGAGQNADPETTPES